MLVKMRTETLRALTDGWLAQDLDAWTRHVLRRHFDPEGGSAYWLKQRSDLGFDPLEISRYDELSTFGSFDLALLRDLDPADLVPRSVPRPLRGRVFESGGTTGRPCRVFYTEAMALQWTAWHQRGRETAGFEPGRVWLDAGPSGPHVVGQELNHLAEIFGSTVYAIDLDPRWIKTLIRGGRLAEMQEYVDHVTDQIVDVLGTRPVDYLRTTPATVQALINRRPDLVAALRGVALGGTQFTPDAYRKLAAAMPNGVIGTTYGNTFGNGYGLPSPDGGATLPYVPGFPHTTMAVVDKDDPMRVVEYGEVGRVRLTVLQEDLFLPNVLERDQAIRHRASPDWPCDGVANVQPLQVSADRPEGLY
ncbi:arylcarboxylate reductase [Streptomyces sp. NPDC086080]|uniref:arylcarboxylate reductase n=1 Tax=Streptomyces sp. NPDC086080 TaxID=3365748 RepID=UPI0037D90F3B